MGGSTMKQRYDSYKPSGIDWIGDIPSHWNIAPLKRNLRMPLKYGANEPAESENKNYPRYIRITDIDSNGNLKDETFKSLEPAKATEYLLEKGDVLFARSGATVGKTYIFNEPYEACFAGYLIKASCSSCLIPQFLFYYTNSGMYNNWKNSIFIQSTIQNIGADKYSILPLPLPPLAEQEAIAAWLDKKCGEIDAAIVKVDREIELIDELKRSEISRAVTHGLNPDAPLRPSGIDWIGDVPEHWGNTRLKFDCSLKGRIGWNGLKSDEFRDLSYAYLVTGQDFKGKNIEWSKCYQIDKWRYDEDPFIQLSNGDLLVTKDGTIGKVALVNNLDKPACLNSGIFVLKLTSKKFKQSYLYWTLVSSQLADFNYFKSGTSTTIQHLYQNIFENMPLVVPPLEEQQAIADYLDKKCAEIDGLRAKLTKKRETLTELRQSIISEVVTGKRKVI